MKNRIYMTLILSLFSSITLLGCATTTDPSKGGFVSGVGGLVGGTYQDRLDARRGRLAEMQRDNSALDQETSALKAEKRQKSRKVAKQQRQVTALQKDINRVKRDIRKTGEVTAKDKREIASMKNRMNTMESKVNRASLDDDGSEQEVRQLKASLRKLEKEYAELSELYLELEQ